MQVSLIPHMQKSPNDDGVSTPLGLSTSDKADSELYQVHKMLLSTFVRTWNILL